MEPSASSFFLPSFLQRLGRADVKTVLLTGCGGGFDFVHGMALYPELLRMGKKVVIGSYSFGLTHMITGEDVEVVFAKGGAMAKKVSGRSTANAMYGPEVHLCSWLDAKYPAEAPHTVYAYYARHFTGPLLHEFYTQLVEKHAVDAVVLVDGGSDSLMKGDEVGLGDPIEDAVSIAAVAALDERVRVKLLLSMGLGCDRFNGVSDAATLRAVAELTKIGGYLGCVGMEPTTEGFKFYAGLIEHIYTQQHFHSVIAGSIVAAGQGYYGSQNVPPYLQSRVKPGELYLWPLMAFIWGFDVKSVATRSLLVPLMMDCKSTDDSFKALKKMRLSITVQEEEIMP